jgi:CBS domain-containing protein
MTSPAISVDSQTSVPEALLLMKERGIRRLPVIDDRQLVGIVTLGDLRGAMPSEATTLNRSELAYLMDQVKVERVMTRKVITVTEDTSIAQAARLILENKIGGLPVLSADGLVVGMVTESDLLRVLARMIEKEEAEQARMTVVVRP